MKGDFLQVVFRFSSEPKIEVKNKSGEIVGQSDVSKVVEYYAFEKDLSGDETPWLVLAPVEHKLPEQNKS